MFGAIAFFWSKRSGEARAATQEREGRMRELLVIAIMAVTLTCPALALAQAKNMTLAVDHRLEASGLIPYIVPRFALKTGIRVSVLAASNGDFDILASDGTADALIGPHQVARALSDNGSGSGLRQVFYTEDDAHGGAFALLLLPGGSGNDHAVRFAEWIVSEVGQRTIAAFESVEVVYMPGALAVAAPEVVLPKGNIDEGERLSHFHCGRCHVVSDKNRFGGIGSTPSFPALRTIPNWEERFRNFWALNPHPSFTQVEGITEPFDPARPPHIAPVVITDEDLSAIVAYASSIRPRDLGADVRSR